MSGPFAARWDAAKFAGGIASPEAVPAAITWMRQGIPPAIIAGSAVLTPRQVGTVLLALMTSALVFVTVAMGPVPP